MRTLASLGNSGHRALTEALANSEWRTVEQALASLAAFASPITVREMNNRPVFRIIRGPPSQRGDINYEKRVMIDTDGNHGPIAAFCWATGFVYKKELDLHFNHICTPANNVELFTNLANICVTPSFLTKITDRRGASLLQYRAWELFGSLLSRETPMKPAGYDRLEWASPLDPLTSVEDRMRHMMSSKPKDSATRSVRELGWIFSSFVPDPTIDRTECHPLGELRRAERTPNANSVNPGIGTVHKNSPTNQEDAPASIEKIRLWAGKPTQNVHRIIGVMVRHGSLPRDRLVQEIQRLGISDNPYGAVASLMTNSGNNYGLVFVEQAGELSFHPRIKHFILQQRWRSV
jgi:hypothetical protein